jgi:hypothetical protein
MTFHVGYIQMTFFSRDIQMKSLKIKTFIVLKLWTFIFFSNRTFLEHAKEISYSLQRDLSNGVS